MWKWSVAFVLLLILLIPGKALADTSSDVTVTATGYICQAPGGLTLTYINDYQVGISWTKGIDAANTMVRGAVGRTPTSRTDGYLVYYGAGISANDTGVSFDETAAPIYYRAWSQNAGGVWENTGISGFIEGGGMTLIALFLLCGILTFVVLWSKNFLLALMGAASWLFATWYTLQSPPFGLVAGSTGHEMLLIVLIGMALSLPAYIMVIGNWGSGSNEEPLSEGSEDKAFNARRFLRNGDVGNRTVPRPHKETIGEYRDRVHRALHPNPPKRRR